MTRKTSDTLTPKEAEIMKMLWEHGPQTVRELLARFPEPQPHFNTVSTTVRILVDKGYVEHTGERSGAWVYAPTAEAADMGERTLAQVVRSYFRNSYKQAVSALVADEKISVDELREIIEMIENQKSR